MARRFALISLFVLLIAWLAGMWIFLGPSDREPASVLPATVNRDCAPWDGPAFTVSVRYDPKTVIYISIWRSPDIYPPSTFSFPDETGRVGNAYILPETGPYTLLSGEVSFQRVEAGTPIEGKFQFTSERGGLYEGRFTAMWGYQVIYCG
jgi:hypothetical protein